MKLRLKNNCLRIRLNRREMAELAEHRTLGSKIDFGPSAALAYRLTIAGETLAANLSADGIAVRIPASGFDRWHGSDTIGIESTQQWDGGSLQILVEKDLACLTAHPGKSDPDAFENPQAGKVTCR